MAKSDTRTRIMDIAENAVLAKGFDATSIEEIVAAAGITKGGFFYHFSDKTALAQALLERYIAAEDALFAAIEAEARALNDDPLGFVLISLELLARKLDDLPNGHPGCLIAAAAYQDRLFDPTIRALNRTAVMRWRDRYLEHFREAAAVYPPREKADLEGLADMVMTAIEGGIIMSKSLTDPAIVGQQVRLVRAYIKLLFSPAAA